MGALDDGAGGVSIGAVIAPGHLQPKVFREVSKSLERQLRAFSFFGEAISSNTSGLRSAAAAGHRRRNGNPRSRSASAITWGKSITGAEMVFLLDRCRFWRLVLKK
jgi:hypothetical protein